ncbi:protein kinase [Metarhizium robertsii]|uniref:non-specific serine/threonine protein kinase n=1 Tax=Metarhizium robertsii TaxID=568076 RepID=A0A0A1UNI7_9HYPO|nr:protein kinase [Metarhizium robertsii]
MAAPSLHQEAFLQDIMVNKKYRVGYKVGEGGFGLVYAVVLGTDVETKQEVAMKLHIYETVPRHSNIKPACTLLYLAKLEYRASCGLVKKAIRTAGAIPRRSVQLLRSGIFALNGPSIADQAIRRVKQIHEHGYLHCDIKRDNLLLGIGHNSNVLYTIDFGLARDLDATDGLGTRDNRPLGGTTRYASVNNHNGPSELVFAIMVLKKLTEDRTIGPTCRKYNIAQQSIQAACPNVCSDIYQID